MNTFHSTELFGAFLVFVFIFMLIVLCDLWYRHCTRPARGRPSHKQHRSIGFHTKQFIARILLKFGKRENIITSPNVDKLQIFADADKMPVDAVYFNTSSVNRQILLFAMARRKNGLINTIGLLRVPEYSKDLLVLPVFPGTTLYQNEDEQKTLQYYTVAGIKIESMIPMQDYRIEYNGKMRHENNLSKEVDVRFSVLWRTHLPTFNFSTDISRTAMSEAMALEHWSREYFNNLKRYFRRQVQGFFSFSKFSISVSHHQSHLEQYGTIEGSVMINGKDYTLRTNGLRDHTIGVKRDWNDFHRYVIHSIYLENGNAITVGIISMPVLFTRLLIGFVTVSKDKVNLPIDSCSIDLNVLDVHHPPDTYEFDFMAVNVPYRVHVKRYTKTKVLMGEQSECSLIETWCDFKVNNIKGWGAVEWQYRNEIPTTEL